MNSSELLKQVTPNSGNKDNNPKPVGKITGSAALLKAASVPVDGLKYVQKKETPVVEEKKPTFGGQIVRGVVKPFVSAGLTVARGAAAPFSKKVRDTGLSVKSNYLGEVTDAQESVRRAAEQSSKDFLSGKQSLGKSLLKPVGASGLQALDVASLLPLESIGTSVTKNLIKEAFVQSGKEAGKFGLGYGLASSLDSGKNFKDTVKTTLGTGAAAFLGGGLLGAGANKLLGNKLQKVAPEVVNKVDNVIPDNSVIKPIETPKVLTPAEKHAQYAASQGYEPYVKPGIIDAGPSIKASANDIQMNVDGGLPKMPGYKYEPIKPKVEPNFTNIPEGPIKSTNASVTIPKSIKGDTLSKAAKDIDVKIINEGFESLPIEEQARFNSVTRQQQVDDIYKLMTENESLAIDAAVGKTKVPSKIDPQILFNTVAKKAEQSGDIDLLRELSTSPIASQRSLLAQKLGAAGVNKSENSVVDIIAENDRNLEKAFERKNGITITEAKNKEIKNILSKKPPVTKQSFESFIREITC